MIQHFSFTCKHTRETIHRDNLIHAKLTKRYSLRMISETFAKAPIRDMKVLITPADNRPWSKTKWDASTSNSSSQWLTKTLSSFWDKCLTKTNKWCEITTSTMRAVRHTALKTLRTSPTSPRKKKPGKLSKWTMSRRTGLCTKTREAWPETTPEKPNTPKILAVLRVKNCKQISRQM